LKATERTNKNSDMIRDPTDNVRNIEAVGESTSCPVSGIVNAVRVCVGTSSGE